MRTATSRRPSGRDARWACRLAQVRAAERPDGTPVGPRAGFIVQREARIVTLVSAHRAPAIGRLALCVAALSLVSCGREKPASDLSFETLPDTAGLAEGAPVLERFEPYRMTNGAVRVTGRARLPDGTKLQIAIKEPDGVVSVAMAHVVVTGSQFDTPPLLGEHGPLPAGRYRFEVLAHFNPEWQPPEVLRALDGGQSLRGPGVTRARNGTAAIFLVREGSL